MPSQLNQLYTSLPVSPHRLSIRILDLDPSLFTRLAPLTGRLRVVSLEYAFVQFAALSYVWGSFSKPTDYIEIRKDDSLRVKVSITSNCQDALFAIRSRFRPLTIWIDAICINQADDEEKVSQLPFMEPIYSQARPTYVWLGHGSQRNYSSIRHLQRVAYRFPLLRYMSLACALRERATAITKLKLVWIIVKVAAINFAASLQYLYNIFGLAYARGFLRSRQERDEQALCDILNREWFQRAWTFQEIVLSTEAIMVCGTKSFHWETLVCAIVALESSTNAWWDTLQFGTAHSLVNVWMTIGRPPPSTLSNEQSKASTNYSFGALLNDAGIVLDKRHFLRACLRVSNWIVAFAVSWLPFLVIATPICIAYPFVDAGLRKRLRVILFGVLASFTPSAAFLYGFILIRIRASLKGLDISKHTSLFNSPPTQCQQPSISISDDTIASSIDPIHGVVNSFRERRATIPADQSFAMHGILRRLGVPLTKPDYAKPLEQIYRDLFCDLLAWNFSATGLLSMAGISSLQGVPSWVPDLANSAGKPRIEEPLRRSDEHCPLNVRPMARILANNLVVRGRFRNTVNYCSGLPNLNWESGMNEAGKESLTQALIALCLWIDLIDWTLIGSSNTNVLSWEIFSVLRGGNRAQELGREYTIPELDNFFKLLKDIVVKMCGNKVMGRLAEVGPFTSVVNEFMDSNPDLLRHVCVWCRFLGGSRSLFTTTDGEPGTSLLLQSVTVGDIIAEIPGLKTPLVLRKHRLSRGFMVVGQAYIPNFFKNATGSSATLEEYKDIHLT